MKVNGERDLTDTPCIGICSTTNLGDEICLGCGRTAEQVIKWNTYTDEQRITINLALREGKQSGK